MKISYAITVCNEFIEIQRLLNFLLENKREQDEIVVQQDGAYKKSASHTPLTPEMEVNLYCGNLYKEGRIKFICDFSLDNHFANFKNNLTDNCSGDYIFQIDADEMPTTYMMDMIPEVLKHNDVDVLKVPRINTVEGLTPEHIAKWNWGVNDQGWVNFPDFQWRIYKNNKKITWVNRVHEVLEGYKTMSYLPTEEQWCLRHDKTIDRQERQNKLYEGL
jgi:hypothetical protein